MASTNSDKQKALSLLEFDENKFGHTLNTHCVYVGTALASIKKNILKRDEMPPLVLSHRDYLRHFLIQCHPLIIEWLGRDKGYASQLTSDSWRQKRTSLAHLYSCAGLTDRAKEVAAVRNPTDPNDRTKRPAARKRMSAVDPKKFDHLLNALFSSDDKDSWSILVVMDAIGVRPCEVARLTIRHCDAQTNKLVIDVLSAKNTLRGKFNDKNRRGIDRTLEVRYSENLIEAINHCKSNYVNEQHFKRWINSARQRVGREAKKVFPNEARRFCFYSLRHQVGSLVKHVFKDDEDGARKVAAVLGHKCTKSQARYGDSGTGKSVIRNKFAIKPSAETVSKVMDNRSPLVIRKTLKSLREVVYVKQMDAILRADYSKEIRERKLKAVNKKFKDNLYGRNFGHGRKS